MPLAEYQRKRDFKKTPEPGPKVKKRAAAKQPIFVVQEHHATRLHWDFRLEHKGVLLSWAVTKEPTLDPKIKRLAVQVEDHPIDYATFHGDIPSGYGAGHVEIFDSGTYTPHDDVGQGIKRGKLHFDLHGKTLKGEFALILTHWNNRPGGKPNWLLFKIRDDYAKAGSAPKDRETYNRPSGGWEPKASWAKSKAVWKSHRDSKNAPSESGNGNGRATSKITEAVRAAKTTKAPDVSQIEFTHEDRVMFPKAKLTKGDVLRYYASVADKLLPHLRDRPMTLERYPEGLAGGEKSLHFWQKNTPEHYPSWIPRVALPTEGGKKVNYLLINDAQTLLYLVNQGAITFHPFFSRVGTIDVPDFVLFDIDPHQSTFANAVKTAKEVAIVLKQEKIESFVKTTGKSGLHVLVPWKEKQGGFAEARDWAMGIAERVVERIPKIATVERSIKARGSRVYLDVEQNAKGKHFVAPYVIRATPEATVSMPMKWSAINARLDPKKFTIKTAPKLLKGKADAFADLA